MTKPAVDLDAELAVRASFGLFHAVDTVQPEVATYEGNPVLIVDQVVQSGGFIAAAYRYRLR